MKFAMLLAGLLASWSAAAIGPEDFVRQWPVVGACADDKGAPKSSARSELHCEGAFAVTLDESVYRQVLRDDLADMAAFNADGEPLPFGPMPVAYVPPVAVWREAPWFALPAISAEASSDLHLHITRSGTGDLSLDATLSHGQHEGIEDMLIDVRPGNGTVEAIALELLLDATDFSAQVSIEASDDLQDWRTVVAAATVAQLRQSGQTLVRRQIEFPPQSAKYLRVRVLGSSGGIPLDSVRLLMRPAAASSELPGRSAIAADFVRREGNAYIYRMPARVPADRLNIVLADDNAIASFSVSARDPGEKRWNYVGQLNAFRLRAAGTTLDNEAMDISTTRRQEWRIEPSIELTRTPRMEFGYRPESWLLLTHGRPPFVLAAGSNIAQRDQFPLEALVAQVRTKYGRDWRPLPAALGGMQTAGGEAALSAYDPGQKRTWLLWAVLLLAAAAIIVMVLRLLRSPQDP